MKKIKLADDNALQSNEVNQTIIPHREPLGSSGTENYSGYNYEEYLHTLHGKQRAKVFDEMRRSDTQIKMCVSSVCNPIKDGTWEIEAADDTPEAGITKDLVEHILFKDMDHSFNSFVSEALTVVPFGHSVFEITHKAVFADKKFGNYNGIRSLGWRSQKTLERWNLNKETGKLASVTQYAYGDLDRMVDIPAQFLLVLTMEKEGSNYEGISLLRPCYGSFFRKKSYLKLNAIGIEKFAVPTPIAKIIGSLQPEGHKALKEALEIYTTHQAQYIITPEGVDITLHSNTYDPQKVEISVDNEDKRIAKAFLANFLELGSSGSGSYALSNDLSDFFLSGINHIANDICAAINTKIIPEIIAMNFPNPMPIPKLKVSGISDKAGKELSEMLVALGGGKWLTPSDNDEDHLRKRIGLPKKSDVGLRSVQPQPALIPTLSERIKLAARRHREQ